jgi:cellulose synthase/poly-beta-1,6-N-acetylglucosamine synthase-like glycosyltransferase
MLVHVLFWIGVCGVVYPYFGYPLLLWLWGRVGGRPDTAQPQAVPPTVSLIVPVHNEAARIDRKLANTAALNYPADRIEVLFVSDGSTDDTVARIRAQATPAMSLIELPERRGKAAGLNAGLARARHDILIFTDASIELEPDALLQIVRQFSDPAIGCVSGEDRIAESGGEAWYGRYELLLRRLESRVHSIVGASGSFYAQRRALCQPFVEGLAPDYLSVLRTVEQGFRAVTEPRAVGAMTSVKDPRQEFQRKVRTLIRGLTTLFAYGHLLNPFRYGAFAFAQFSHKVMRWLAPFFLLLLLVVPLARLDSPWYLAAFAAQAAFYLVGAAAMAGVAGLRGTFIGKLAIYFSSVHVAILAAWIGYGRGVRQEIWTPSQR